MCGNNNNNNNNKMRSDSSLNSYLEVIVHFHILERRSLERLESLEIPNFPKKIEVYNAQCVCVFSSHSFWTSSSLDVPAGVTQEEGYTGFLIHLLSAVRALIFLARRIQPFLSLVDREVKFCVLTI